MKTNLPFANPRSFSGVSFVDGPGDIDSGGRRTPARGNCTEKEDRDKIETLNQMIHVVIDIDNG